MQELKFKQEEERSLLKIEIHGKTLFKIDEDGTITYTLNGEPKILESEKELAILFSIFLAETCGIYNQNKDDLITKVIKNYREGKINDLLG